MNSDSKEDLINLADKILQEWRQYSDPEVQILAETDGIRITPSHPLRVNAMDSLSWTWFYGTIKLQQSILMASIIPQGCPTYQEGKYRLD